MSHKNEKPELTPAQWAMVEANLDLIDDVASKHFPSLARERPHYFRALGTPGLEDSVRTFDPARGQLRSYAWMRIRGAILSGMEADGSCAAEAIQKARLPAADFASCQTEGPARRDDTQEQASARFEDGLRGFARAWEMGWVFGGRGDDAETPLRRAARTRDEDDALAGCETLPDRERQVVELRYRDELTWPQIEEKTGIPEGTLYYHHHRAVKRLAARARPKKVDPVE